MIAPKDMTRFQKVVTGLRIFEEYLSPQDNPGQLSSNIDLLRIAGVHRDALGGDDLAKLAAMGWQWIARREEWTIEL